MKIKLNEKILNLEPIQVKLLKQSLSGGIKTNRKNLAYIMQKVSKINSVITAADRVIVKQGSLKTNNLKYVCENIKDCEPFKYGDKVRYSKPEIIEI